MSREVPFSRIKELIEGETFDSRFKCFGAGLSSVRDGIAYTTMNATGDLGRDAYANAELAASAAAVCARTTQSK